MSSLKGQGAISSLVYSSSALTTAASLGYVFGKPSKSITSSLSSSSSSISKKNNYVNTTTINDNNFPVKKRFNLFRLKSNKHHRHRHNHCDSDNRNNNKIISDDVTFDKMIAEPETFIVNYFQTPPSTPPTSATYHHYHHHHHHHHHNHHPSLMVLPDQLTIDDDVSSLCSDATSFYLSDRSKSCSVTTFATLSNTNINNINTNSNNNNNNNNNNHSLIWDENNSNNNNSIPMSVNNVAVLNGHNLTEILLEEDEEENWNDNSSVEEDKNAHSNNNLNSGDGGDDILIDSSSSTSSSESSPSASRKKSKKKINRTSLPPPEHNRSPTPLKHHHRCKSLPPIPLSELSPSFYRQPTPSESWDNDFVLDDLELNVPNSVKDAQISLKMDIYTIKDFVSQIEELKTLYDDKLTLSCTIKSKMKRRRWSNGFLSNDAKKYNALESMFKEHWEEAAVIIDLSEIAQDREPMFGGGKHVEVDIENIPSKRHLKVLKRIIEKEMANNNCNTNNTNNLDYYGDDDDDDKDGNDDDKDDDDHKENHHKKPKLMFNNNRAKRFSLPSSSSSSSSKIMTKTTRNKKKKEKKYSDFRISVEVMPSLVEHLRKLQESLTEHVNELKIIAKQ